MWFTMADVFAQLNVTNSWDDPSGDMTGGSSEVYSCLPCMANECLT